MTEKTEFALIVPAMFQEKAVDWVLSRIDCDLDEIKEAVENGTVRPDILDHARLASKARSRILKDALISLYDDEGEKK